MNSSELREKFLNFFKEKGHTVIPSASLIPENDSSTLFTSSGMQPLVPYLLGEKHPEGTRLCNSQKSFRAADIEEVGDSRHTTFFEMLGNWSLGDYFKKEQLPWIFEFLVKEVGLDANRLYSTVFEGDKKIGVPKDTESIEILKDVFKKYGIDAKEGERIFCYSAKKNWWSRSGEPSKMPVGEIGGPDSEIFFDLGAELKKHENSLWANELCHVNCDCGRYVEIANSVFMQYQKTENGFGELKQRNVDFGGGLERIAMVSQNLDNVFETDLFINIIKKIENLSGKNYRENPKPFEVISDHLKAATFIMGDGKDIVPSNVGQGYIVRRLIRRAIRFGKNLEIKERDWIKEIAEIVAQDYKNVYPEIQKNIIFITEELSKEEEKFDKTLENGLKEFEKISAWWRSETDAQIGGGKNYKVNEDNVKLSEQLGIKLFYIYQSFGFPLELSLEELENRFGEKFFFKGQITRSFHVELEKHQELSRTASAGTFKGGLADNSEQTTKLHTAAHLMLAGLRKVLGTEVYQKGSNITAERLRFDFSHKEKMASDQIKQVEDFVNEAIKEDAPVVMEEVTLEKAKELGAMGVFESKYGEKVKVYTIEKNGKIISREICGGPHVERTGILGHFKIQREESSSSGVRRIKAILE